MSFLSNVIAQLWRTEPTEPIALSTVGGGCIHQAGYFEYDGEKYFLKWNTNAQRMFETEAKGLALLRETGVIQVPAALGWGQADGMDFLCMEYLEKGLASPTFWEAFGANLAYLHRCSGKAFGLDHDNYIGSLCQTNTLTRDWGVFFVQHRLLPQIQLARDRGLLDRGITAQFDLLFSRLDRLIPQEQPALLHGDLWSGNFLINTKGRPVLFDPAVYYGHREAELAFTRLFGGFDTRFYESYQAIFPLQPGHEERTDLFNLYPLLVHVNLFGNSYLSGIVRTLRHFT